MKYKMWSKGDNHHDGEFANKYEMYTYLYGILGKLDRYFSDDDPPDEWFCLDIEDDLLVIEREDGEVRAFTGWHWDSSKYQPIIMPCGKTLYQLVSEYQS